MFDSRLSTAEKIELFDNLSVLFNAGLPLLEILDSITEETHSKRLKKIVTQTTSRIKEGQKFSDSLKNFPDFSPIQISLLRTGEASGKLPDALNSIVVMEKRYAELKEKLVGALIYPIIIFFVMIGIVFIMFFYVIPRFSAVFKDMKVGLPLLTRLIFGTSDFMNAQPLIFLVIFTSIVLSLFVLFSRAATRAFLFRLLYLVSLFREMFNRIDLANFCQTFAILLSSGVPVLEALESSQAMVRSETYNNAIKKISLKVTQGKSLSESFREDKDVFPPFLLHIISVGEKSGSLDTMLKKASDIYTEKVNSNIKTMTALIEPIFLVLIAIGASGLVFSIIMP